MSNGKQAQSRRESQDAARARRTRYIMIAVVVAVVLAIGISVLASNRTSSDTNASAPAGVLDDLGVPVGTATSPVLDIYEDFQCPVCAALEHNVGAAVAQMAADGDVLVVYHIMSFLDINLSNDSSTRAANAAGCAQDQGVFEAYHDQVFANQPAEGVGYTDDQLITFGANAGVSDMTAFRDCVTSETYADWVAQVERRAEDDQIHGTPTLLINGTQFDASQAQTWDDYVALLRTAIQQAG
jgi:protein-disulfide isomerase